MNYWRMAMRIGNQGPSQWPDCLEKGIAAIGYYHNEKPVIRDCRNYTEDEYNGIWKQKRPLAGSPRASLHRLAYEMKKGDTIYIKEGIKIVGKGKITEEYNYDQDILYGAQEPWEHFVRVKWEEDFTPFKCKLGAEQTTVLNLTNERLEKLLEKESEIKTLNITVEAEEGEQHKTEIIFRKRNRAIIEAKKANSDYCCEICSMNFEEIYGKLGEGYIVAHHKNPIGYREESSPTTLDDIALVCPNCHAMLHKKNPPLTIEELKLEYDK